MTCQDIKEKIPDYLIGDLIQEEMARLQNHIASCPACREELESLSAIWTKLGVLPEATPDVSLRTKFYGMLEDYKNNLGEAKVKQSFLTKAKNWFQPVLKGRPVFQLSFSFSLLVLGLITGYLLTGKQRTPSAFGELQREVQDMRQTLAVALLDQSSASDRLRGVNLSLDTESPESGLIDALLNTLNTDPNINVRLAAVDALYLFYDLPQVQEGIAQTLSNQESPLVQVALIDLLVSVRERRAVQSLKELIQSESLHPEVKQRAELGLQKIGI